MYYYLSQQLTRHTRERHHNNAPFYIVKSKLGVPHLILFHLKPLGGSHFQWTVSFFNFADQFLIERHF